MAFLSAEFYTIAAILLAAGALTGVLAGAFGVGGGALIVPVLYEGLRRGRRARGHAHAALPSGRRWPSSSRPSVRSWRGHRARGAVDDALLKVWALPIVLGVLVGAVVARVAPAEVFQAVFIGVACVNAIKLVSGTKRWNLATDLPTGIGLRVYGWIIGLLSSLMGIGGGQITNMIMTLHGRPIHQAVATFGGSGHSDLGTGRDRLRTGGMGTARSSRGRDRLRFASRSRVVRADNDPDRRSRGFASRMGFPRARSSLRSGLSSSSCACGSSTLS